MAYLNCTDAAIAEAERQRTGNYGDYREDEQTEEIGYCEQCGRGIKADKHYVKSCDGIFCDDECFQDYYGYEKV